VLDGASSLGCSRISRISREEGTSYVTESDLDALAQQP